MAGERMSEQEAREKFPHGGWYSDLSGNWFPAQVQDRIPAVQEWLRYLPLDASDITCPRCMGSGDAGTGYPDYDMGYADCSTCNGTGKVPADSILHRIREQGRFP